MRNPLTFLSDMSTTIDEPEIQTPAVTLKVFELQFLQ
jgi:hypothetical protein